MTLNIRPAGPQDAPFLAEAMYESTVPVVNRGLFDLALTDVDIDPLKFNEALLLSGASHWGQLDSFIIVEEDGEPAGACAAYLSSEPDRRPLTPEGLKLVSEHLGWPADVGRRFWMRYASQFGLFGDLPQLHQPAPYVLEYTAIRAKHRGRGLLAPLLSAHVDRARSQGHKMMGVSAVIGNDAALKAYTKFGFQFHKRVGPEEYGNAYPGMDRLLLEI
jgi:GNAT superfamily N-acetyltransferase